MPKRWTFGEKQAWIRFFIGLGGLAFSFGAALWSTALRQGGYPLLAAAVASIALLSAGLVGLYTVPYLAKRVVRERWIDAFEYEITKEGIVYLAAVLVISIAALNTGNNLLFIIISAMLAAIVISGVASAFTLRRLQVDLSLPEQVFAQQTVIARIRIINRRRWPIFSIQVRTAEDHRGKFTWRRTTFHVPPRRKPGKVWWTMTDWYLARAAAPAGNQSPQIEPVYFPYLPAGAPGQADVSLTFPRRGVFLQRALAVSTRFPFSFVKKTRKVSLRHEVIVLPRIESAEQVLSALPSLAGEYDSLVRGQGHDLYRIREHLPGDAGRSIDWKATARSTNVMVREFSRDDDRRVRIVYDNPVAGTVAEPEYERMVTAAASLGWHLHARGVPLEFVAPEHHSTDVSDFLEYLATVGPDDQPGHLPELGDDAFTIVITAGSWQRPGDRCHILRFGPSFAAR